MIKKIIMKLKESGADSGEKSSKKADKWEELHEAKKLASYEFFDAVEKKDHYKLCSSLSDLLVLISEEEEYQEKMEKEYKEEE